MITKTSINDLRRLGCDSSSTVCAKVAVLLRRFASYLDGQHAPADAAPYFSTVCEASIDVQSTDSIDPTSDQPNDPQLASQRFETEVELLTLGKIVAVLERQLKDVNHDIEKSVIGISQGFQGMARQAQAAVNVVGSVAADEDGGIGKISEMQTVINRLVSHMNESCESLGDASHRLSDMEGRLDGVETVLSGIEEIAARSRLMALNGQIEAGRLGAAGAAFAVVASETKQLSQHAADTSSRAQGLLSELSDDITSTTKDLSSRSKTDASRLLDSKQEAEAILIYIEENHSKMMKVLNDTGSISRELQSSISRAVISLQFQDRVSQRMEHVINSLKLICDRVRDRGDDQYDWIAEERSQVILSELSKGYTMDAERLALTGAESQAGSSGDSFDVELF
ncbi:MAG TPA: hypothetical protein DDZ51_30040 [Planctomycetaceae bacterium]|nr:hypothetical protein [Planctomycetaceae bacterium]